MARVVLTATMAQRFADGKTEFEIEAANVRGIIRAMEALLPGIGPHLEEGTAVAIDGQIFQDAFLEPVKADSEVYFLPRIAGG